MATLDDHSAPQTEPENSTNENYTLYVVQSGDNLWGIARKLPGAGGKWT